MRTRIGIMYVWYVCKYTAIQMRQKNELLPRIQTFHRRGVRNTIADLNANTPTKQNKKILILSGGGPKHSQSACQIQFVSSLRHCHSLPTTNEMNDQLQMGP